MIYWIDCPTPGRLGTMARPRAGDWLEDEIADWKRERLSRVVSLLQRDEVEDLGLELEQSLCESAGIGFDSFPIVDRGTPESTLAAEVLGRDIVTSLQAGQSVAIHCRAGIGRASLMAALVLQLLGRDTETALRNISTARGLIVPDTDGQRSWLRDFEPVR